MSHEHDIRTVVGAGQADAEEAMRRAAVNRALSEFGKSRIEDCGGETLRLILERAEAYTETLNNCISPVLAAKDAEIAAAWTERNELLAHYQRATADRDEWKRKAEAAEAESEKAWDEFRALSVRAGRSIADLEAQLAAAREALERIANYDCFHGGRAIGGNDRLPGCEDFYKGYNAGISTQFNKTRQIAREAIDAAREKGGMK